MAQIDMMNGLVGTLAVKAPCKVATTANITLSGAQTIDGVLLTADASPRQRVLVKDQTTASENGIYDVNSGAWSRSPDFDGARDVVRGTIVSVTEGHVGVYEVMTVDPITIGTSSITFALASAPSVGIDTIYEISTYSNNLATAVTAIGVNPATLLIDRAITENTVVPIPESLTLWFINPGKINGTGTIAFSGSPDLQIKALPGQQIFGLSTTVTFAINPRIPIDWFGAKGDNLDGSALANTTAINAAAVCAGYTGTVLIGTGTYKVTATAGSYAVTFYGAVKGDSTSTSILKNIGTGSAVAFKGENDSSGTFYNIRCSNFSVVGNSNSEDGIVTNPDLHIARPAAYSYFENVDSYEHGRHGLKHNYSWATKYINCKFRNNGGLGVYLNTGATSEHNNIVFENCDARWNGGTGDASADYTKGGVRISGNAYGVYWRGGVVESNNAWGFIIGEESTSSIAKVVIDGVYSENQPSSLGASTTGGHIRVSANYKNILVTNSTLPFGGHTTGVTGYAFYIDDAAQEVDGFTERDNYVPSIGGLGTCIRDYGITYTEKWGSNHEIINLQADRDFSNTNHWVNDDFNAFDNTGDITAVSTGTQFFHLPATDINNGAGFVYGKRYGIKYDVSASGTAYFASSQQAVKLPSFPSGTTSGIVHEFIWTETNANQGLYVFSDGVAIIASLDNIHIYEIDSGNEPQNLKAGLLSISNVNFAADGDNLLYIVPVGKRCVLTSAVVVAGADAGASTTLSIGAAGSTTDFIPNNTLSNLDAQYDSVILQPIPNTTPLKGKSYAADTVIYGTVGSHSGGAINALYLYGFLY